MALVFLPFCSVGSVRYFYPFAGLHASHYFVARSPKSNWHHLNIWEGACRSFMESSVVTRTTLHDPASDRVRITRRNGRLLGPRRAHAGADDGAVGVGRPGTANHPRPRATPLCACGGPRHAGAWRRRRRRGLTLRVRAHTVPLKPTGSAPPAAIVLVRVCAASCSTVLPRLFARDRPHPTETSFGSFGARLDPAIYALPSETLR